MTYNALAMKDKDPKDINSNDQAQPGEIEPTIFISPKSELPTQIGSFQILELLGSGGMGDVYLAEQKAPIKRLVALKVIKLGMDTKEVITRFESERQALAMMNHPNVAKIYETGSTENGRPYFVMEHVPGEMITAYCDRHKLDLKSRLDLFMSVCQAIHHAHQKGIIHRDIKPTNVLVTVQDGEAVPKVIDFGVAKAIQQNLTERTLFTEQGRMIGTPSYMSPEQAEMTGLNIDTTSDVYSLGVLLYEILVGVLPFEERQLREAGIAEMHRIIRDVDPAWPSTKIGSMGEQATEKATRRGLTPKVLRKLVHGELDWITMRAMEKDRTRRYQSASELATDIGRYLAIQPVLAHRPSATYQVKKLIARHKVRSGLLALLVVVLAGSVVGMSIQAGKITRERDRALAAEQQTRTEAETAMVVSQFLVSLFEVSDPSEARGNSVTAREILDRGAVRIGETLSDQPEVQGRLMATMGSVYMNLGLFDNALELAEEAYRLRHSLFTGDHKEIVRSLRLLSELYTYRGEFDKAEELNREALAMSRRVFGNESPVTADILQILAINLKEQNRLDEAEKAYREVMSIRRKLVPFDPVPTASSLTSLGELMRVKDQLDDAEALHREALNLMRKVGFDFHPVMKSCLNNLALVFESRESYNEAEEMLREALQIDVKLSGAHSPEYATTLSNLAGILKKTGKLDESIELHREALSVRQEALAADHPLIAASLNNLSTALLAKGELDEAAILLVEALEVIRQAMGEDHPRVGITLYNLGKLENRRKNYSEARRRFQEAEPRLAKIMPADHWRMGNLHSMIGLCLAHEGRFAEGESLVLSGFETVKTSRGDQDKRTRTALERVVEFYELANRTSEANTYREMLEQIQQN